MSSPEVNNSITQDQLTEVLNLTPLGDYVVIDNDTIRFRDLVTRDILQPGQVPPAVSLHPTIGEGIGYLEVRGAQGNLGVDFLLAPHSEPEDFYCMVETYPQAFNKPFFAIEANWTSDDPGRSTLPQHVQPQMALNDESRRSFQEAQIDWLQEHHKIILPSDMRMDDSSPLYEELDKLWNEVIIPVKNNDHLSPRQRKAASMIAERAYQATRQWGIMGQFGQWLWILDRAGYLSYGDKVPIMLGRWHAPSVTRLDDMGIHTRTFHDRRITKFDTPEYKAFGEVAMQATYDCAITLEQLAIPKPY